MKLSLDQMQSEVEALWGSSPAPLLTVAGSQCQLVHPVKNASVLFSLTREDRDMAIKDFGTSILRPAVTALQEKMDG